MTDADFQAMLDVHTIVPFRVLRAAAPHLREPAKRERTEGREVFRKVVNVSSMAAYGNAGQANYASAKAGVIGLTKTLAREWGQFKICVNAVAFGFIDTRLTAAKSEDTVIEVQGRTIQVGVPEQARAMLGAMVPVGRAGTPAEAAGGIAFLCSPWSDYVTGQVLNVGGGVPFGTTS
jgi:3-oxoacyl-[acyl-carrier protein] reductase